MASSHLLLLFYLQPKRRSSFERRFHYPGLHAFTPAFVVFNNATPHPRLNNTIIAVRRPLEEINRDSPLFSNELQGIDYPLISISNKF